MELDFTLPPNLEPFDVDMDRDWLMGPNQTEYKGVSQNGVYEDTGANKPRVRKKSRNLLTRARMGGE